MVVEKWLWDEDGIMMHCRAQRRKESFEIFFAAFLEIACLEAELGLLDEIALSSLVVFP